ncbi:hypothetical protein ACIPY5_15035 [Microbacterium sp. NPDC089698]|uniref:hypothetical protein n=1 Tax=Microbacterium sp. NPDC089698 TaxID=3364200 RepID=UPI0037F6118D
MSKWRSGGSRPANQAEIDEADDLRAIARAQLPIIRVAATNWRNGVGLGGVLALVMTSATGPEALKQLGAQAKYDTAWLLGLGALVTFVSLALAMYASFGWPTPAKIGTTGGLRAWEAKSVVIASWCLTVSMILAAAALVVLGAGVAVMVFGVPWPWPFPGWDAI